VLNLGNTATETTPKPIRSLSGFVAGRMFRMVMNCREVKYPKIAAAFTIWQKLAVAAARA